MEPAFVSLKQAGRVLGVSASTARELVHGGHLPHARIGRRVLVHVGGLRAYADRLAGVEDWERDALEKGAAAMRRMEAALAAHGTEGTR